MKLRFAIALAASAAAGFALGLLARSDHEWVRYLTGWRADRVAVAYVPPRDAKYQTMHDLLKEQRVLEKFREYLSPIRLPEVLTLKFDQCGTANAWYEASDHTVTVCYEYVAEAVKSAPRETTPEGVTRIDAIVGPVTEVFLHEAAHAVFDMLKVPIFGREEDAADQFAAFLLLRLDKEEARRAIGGAAHMYLVEAKSSQPLEMHHFANEHGLPAQRLYNLLCIAYGGAPALFADVVEKGFLPKARAESCEDEYEQVAYAFNVLIARHLDATRSKKLKGRRWLPNELPLSDLPWPAGTAAPQPQPQPPNPGVEPQTPSLTSPRP
jgi:hypothetical protein